MSRFRIVVLSLALLLFVVGAVTYLGYAHNKQEETRLAVLKDKSLLGYEQAKLLAESSISLLTMDSQQSYLSNKEKFKDKLSPDLYDMLFSGDSYTGSGTAPKVGLVASYGDLTKDFQNEYVIRLDLRIVVGISERNVQSLIFIRNGKIYKMQSLL